MSSTFDSHGESALGGFFESSLNARSPGKFKLVADLNNARSKLVELDAGVYWMGASDVLYRSTDDGETWASYGSPPTSVIEMGGYGTRLFAVRGGTTGDIYRSTDSGANWSAVYDVASQGFTGIDANSGGVVYASCNATGTIKITQRSTDAGDTWSNNITVASGEFYSEVHACSSSIWFMRFTKAAQPDQFWRSSDDSATWANVLTPTDVGRRPLKDGTTVIYSNQKSTDSGATWSAMTIAEGCNVFGKQGTDYYGVAGSQIYRSTDSGATWSEFQDLGTGNGVGVSLGDILGLSTGAIIILCSNGKVYRKG